ncbi:GNAT family N-acetyltransferase [Comamonas sp. NoAH]|uniref:GNAT family N-acetyltransferase n=1 Tax=Comamonas halotolerans TaxID=3041496 RepID=UPI0024E0A466|nr:GNAT family N-acetyltransferase [Comamonas sp. NoAH]
MIESALSSAWIVRPLNSFDVDSLLHVQTICYGNDFLESREVFSQRLSCPHHCSIGVSQKGARTLSAYLAAYWSNPGKITPLDGFFSAPSAGDQVLYLHDMSVLPELSGQGVARHLVAQLFAQARQRGLKQAALVSVQGSQSYWERQGFSVCPVIDAQQSLHLQTYGEGAVYMTAAL